MYRKCVYEISFLSLKKDSPGALFFQEGDNLWSNINYLLTRWVKNERARLPASRVYRARAPPAPVVFWDRGSGVKGKICDGFGSKKHNSA